MRPWLAFTMGDPYGIGPEVAVAAMRDLSLRGSARILAVGDRAVFTRAGWRPGLCPLVPTSTPVPMRARRGPSVEGGLSSYEACVAALKLAARGVIAGFVTAPICKESWVMAGLPFQDHTEWLRQETASPHATMMLAAGGMRAVLATRHVPLEQVARHLTYDAVADAAFAADRALRLGPGLRRPSLGLCALNPHAGEHGLLGKLESTLLAPAVRRLRRAGLRLEGPLPADAAWSTHARGRYDALIALYHDQALIPLKIAAPYGVINWTIGTPLVRTSPGHGTAFDIAGRGKADPTAMIQAALWAARIAAAGPSSG